MVFYYLEYIQLNDDLSIPENAPWIPATVAISEPVVNGALARLDTTTVPDGLYALRLVVVTKDQQSYTDTVLPIRVNNERFTAYAERVIEQALLDAGIIVNPTPEPTLTPVPPQPTQPFAFPAPGLWAVNVRFCDQIDNDRCPIQESMDGRGADVLGISTNGTGWYLVRLPSGLEGWVSPTVVTVIGDTSILPFLAPPAPLPPPALPNVILNGIAIRDGSPTCGVNFEVEVNVANIGSAVADGATVTLQDVNLSTGEVTATAYNSFPALNPGGNYVVLFSMVTSAFYNETHELRASLGSENVRVQYVLQQGNCGVEPTPPPPPPPPDETFFNPNQCFIVLTSPWPAFAAPYGELITQLAARAWEARSLSIINGEYWYSINTAELGVLWVTRVNNFLQGNCGQLTR
ncbi:MAG: hypothetical protein HXY41_11835 [Chloroflexi bacterium]|nr:hypothetical protein [Chloroflexota bacterium]